MPPTCAACLLPIAGAGNFVIAETEVLHKSCARVGRKTELWRQRELTAGVREANERAIAVAEARRLLIDRMKREELVATRKLTKQWRAANAELSRMQQLTRTQADAISNLERQLAQARAVSAAPPDPVVVATQTTESGSGEPSLHDLDDSAARFALLELDPL